MTKSISQIFSEEFEKVFLDKNPEFRKLKELIDNINPSEICISCGDHCGKKHLLCASCYTNIR